MFGTLISDLQHEEPLTFVENTDPASALSRNRRDKPHASCELCRARKIRCSGQSSGCDKCVAISAECRYRDRIGRRRRRQASNLDTTRAMSTNSTSSSILVADGKQQGEEQQARQASTATEQQQHHEDVKGGLGEWLMDIDGLLDPMLCTQLGSPSSPMEVPSNLAWDSLLGEDNNAFGSGSVDFGTSNKSIPSPSSLEHLLAPSLDFQPVSVSGEQVDEEELQLSTRILEFAPENFREAHQQPQPPAHQSTNPVTASTAAAAAALLPPAATISSKSSTDDRCRCRQLTVSLFEELCAESASSSQADMDVLLRYFRGALVHCATILDCAWCASASESSSSNMLLAMAGQYMSTICERIAVCYARIRRRSEKERQQRSISAPLDRRNGVGVGDDEGWDSPSDGAGAGDMWFATYRIESSHERVQVLRCLVTVQLADFSRLMERLKRRAGSRSGHLMLLTDAEKRIGAAKSLLLDSAGAAASRSYRS